MAGDQVRQSVSIDRIGRPRRVAGGVVLVASALWATTGCTSDEAPAIEVGQVSRATVGEVVEAPANVVARASATVSAPAAGTIAEITVKDGQRVTRGQVLFRIDSPSATRTLAQARDADAQVAAGGGGVTLPKIDLASLDRSDKVAEQAFTSARTAASAIPDAEIRAVALARIAEAEADHAEVQASLRRTFGQLDAGLSSLGKLTSSLTRAQRSQTQAAVAAAEGAVDALTVRAPISGVVVFGGGSGSGGTSGAGGTGSDLSGVISQLPSSLQGQAQGLLGSGGSGATSVVESLEAGMPVASGTGLLTITDVSALTLRASVDETDVLLVRPGITAEVELDAVPGAVYAATVRSVDLQPTTSARGGVSYLVRLSLGAGRGDDGGAAPAPRPGMSAVARLRVRTATDAVSVPAASVFRDGAHDAVWVVEGGRAHRRDVTLGAQGDDRVEVSAGLTVGQSVVVRGADRASEGLQVEER